MLDQVQSVTSGQAPEVGSRRALMAENFGGRWNFVHLGGRGHVEVLISHIGNGKLEMRGYKRGNGAPFAHN